VVAQISSRTDKQTDTQRHTHHNTLYPLQGQSKNTNKAFNILYIRVTKYETQQMTYPNTSNNMNGKYNQYRDL